MKKLYLILIIVALASLALAQQQPASTDTTSAVSAAADQVTKELQQEEPAWSITFGKLFWSFVVFLLGFVSIRYISRLLEAFGEKYSNFRLTIKGLIPILRILGWTFISYIIIADIIAPPIATLVAITASACIAVGFASQDILKNIFGGIMILFDRPFQVGDKIEVGQYYGEVVSIGLRTVRVVTPDDSLVAIPNSEIVNQSVSNANAGESNCQVVAEFYLPPQIDMGKLKGIAYRAAAVSKFLYLNKPIAIIIKNEMHQGRSLLKLRLKAYVLDIRYEFPFMSDMTETVMAELLRQGLVSADELANLPVGN